MKISTLAVALALLAPSVALGAGSEVVPISPEPIILAFSEGGGEGVGGYLKSAHMAGVVAVAFIAVIMIIWGAVQVFGESIWGKSQGKEKIWNAIWGLLLAMGSFVILKTISESLLNADFNISGLSSGVSSGASSAGAGLGNGGVGGGLAPSNNSPQPSNLDPLTKSSPAGEDLEVLG